MLCVTTITSLWLKLETKRDQSKETKKYPKGGKGKFSRPEGASILCQQYRSYVHVIPIQQLVLGAKGNFSIPD